MIKYIDGRSQLYNVSDIMKSVNNYMNILDAGEESTEQLHLMMMQEYEKCYEYMDSLNQGYMVTPYNPIPFQGKKGKIKEIIKRIIRKCIVWYTTDLCNQQTNINSTMVYLMNHQLYIMQGLIDENKKLHDKLDELTHNREGKDE